MLETNCIFIYETTTKSNFFLLKSQVELKKKETDLYLRSVRVLGYLFCKKTGKFTRVQPLQLVCLFSFFPEFIF